MKKFRRGQKLHVFLWVAFFVYVAIIALIRSATQS